MQPCRTPFWDGKCVWENFNNPNSTKHPIVQRLKNTSESVIATKLYRYCPEIRHLKFYKTGVKADQWTYFDNMHSLEEEEEAHCDQSFACCTISTVKWVVCCVISFVDVRFKLLLMFSLMFLLIFLHSLEYNFKMFELPFKPLPGFTKYKFWTQADVIWLYIC